MKVPYSPRHARPVGQRPPPELLECDHDGSVVIRSMHDASGAAYCHPCRTWWTPISSLSAGVAPRSSPQAGPEVPSTK